jgi:hypothetical protein
MVVRVSTTQRMRSLKEEREMVMEMEIKATFKGRGSNQMIKSKVQK